jgi:hypothetical protein
VPETVHLAHLAVNPTSVSSKEHTNYGPNAIPCIIALQMAPVPIEDAPKTNIRLDTHLTAI